MVKGISKRVIVVKSPDPRVFEEAIFIVKEDLFHKSTVDPGQVIEEARRVADGYIKSTRLSGKLTRLPPGALIAMGALVMGLCWLGARLLGWC